MKGVQTDGTFIQHVEFAPARSQGRSTSDRTATGSCARANGCGRLVWIIVAFARRTMPFCRVAFSCHFLVNSPGMVNGKRRHEVNKNLVAAGVSTHVFIFGSGLNRDASNRAAPRQSAATPTFLNLVKPDAEKAAIDWFAKN
jgi:hypothetical protein